MENITITFSNGTTKEYEKNTDFYTISLDYPMENKVIAAKVNNEIFPLDTKVTKSETVEFIDVTSLAGYKAYQSGLKYLFLVAVSEIYPDADVHFLHSVPRGILSEIRIKRSHGGISRKKRTNLPLQHGSKRCQQVLFKSWRRGKIKKYSKYSK